MWYVETKEQKLAFLVSLDRTGMLDVYLKPYPGYYLTGDGCVRDKVGQTQYWFSLWAKLRHTHAFDFVYGFR